MKKSRTWFERRKASLCIISALCAMSLCAIIGLGENGRKPESLLYAVTIRHYGVDAAEMERTVAIPLEDAVSSIPGIAGVYGSSENSMTKVLVRFNGGAKGHYDALREAAQRVYEGLPQSAQRPEIQSAGSSLIPVWSAVVSVRDDAGDISALHIERILKPRLESLEGAGEVLVSGGGPPELIVTLDPEKAAALGLVPSSAAAVLAMNDALFSGGILAQGEREIIVSVDGRFDTGDSSSLGGLFIPLGEGRAVSLSEVAFITGRERRPDSLSRINGKKASVVSVMAGSGADLRKLSKNINREITDPSLPFTFNVLSDRGAEEAAALRSVFSAAAQGALMVAIIGFALSRRKLQGRKLPVNFPGVFCGLSVPVVCLVSAALLSACGLPLDRSVLAGIAAGLGTAIDSVILSSERFKRCKSYGEAGSSLRSLSGPLAAGAATTIAALLPIPAMANSGGQDDAAVIAVSIAVVTIAALALSLGPLPPLLLWNMDGKNGGLQKAGGKAKIGPVFRKGSGVFDKVAKRISRIAGRFLAVSVKCSVKRPWLVITAGLAVSACGLIVLCVKGTDTGSYGSGSSVYAHVEFEGGLLAEEADCLLAGFGESLAGGYGIVNAETTAKTGSGSVMISFDPKKTSAENVRDLARRIPFPGAFLFFPEAASKERHWEIKIFGDDSRRCREIAEETARSLAASPLVKERILNFKQGSLRMDLLPDREKMASLGLNFSLAADSVRRAVHGPVAYKRVSPAGETDVRFFLGGDPSAIPAKSRILEIPVSLPGTGGPAAGAMSVDSLFTAEDGYELSGIKREDRRRTASVTIVTKAMDPRRVKDQVMPLLGEIDLPAGYSVEFDPGAIRQAEALSKTVLYFLLALLFCYMVLASVNESFTVPLAILFAVPPSLAVPAIILGATGFPFNTAAACAFVAVSGMTVNAAVLCAGGIEAAVSAAGMGRTFQLYRSLRRNFPALAATTVTTVAGAAPFLFLREGANTLVRTMALVTSLGVGASCLCAVSAVPAVLLILKTKTTPVSPETISA